MPMPVTVAIPFLNAAPYLADAIRSVFAQTHVEWELLLIDDGSTDGSLRIATQVRDERVRVLSDGINRGLAARLNQVTQVAQFGLLARMDADDLMDPQRLAHQVSVLEADPTVDLVSTGLYSIHDDGKLVGRRGSAQEFITFEDLVTRRKGIVHASVVARRAWHERNPYNELLRYVEDVELWLRASSRGDLSVRSLADPLYLYREQRNLSGPRLARAYALERAALLPHLTDRRARYRFVAGSYGRQVAVRVLETVDMMDRLETRRNPAPLTPVDHERCASIIAAVRSTRVPGLDD